MTDSVIQQLIRANQTYLDGNDLQLCNQSNHTGTANDTGRPSTVQLVLNVYYGIIYLIGMSGNGLVLTPLVCSPTMCKFSMALSNATFGLLSTGSSRPSLCYGILRVVTHYQPLYVVCRYSKMHTVTNFFILSLALADLCFLVNLPFLMVTAFKETWIFGDLYCKIFYSMTTVNQFASSFFLMVMSGDRYFAVCHPIRSNKYRTARAAIVVCSIIWITSIILMIPIFISAGLSPHPDIKGTCTLNWPGNETSDGNETFDGLQAFTLYCFVIGFAFPLFLIVVFYSMVLRKLRTLGPQNSQTQSESRKRSHRRVTIMVLAVITAYVVCYLPHWIAQVLLVYTNVPSYFETLVEGNPQTCERSINFGRQTVVSVVSVLNALCYTNSCVNPILYAMLSENFKKSFAAACYGRRHVELERPSAPDQSIYQRSRASIRRHLRQSRDEDDEEHPFTPRTEEKVEETCFLKVPGQNGVVQLGAGMRYRNGSADLTTATTGDHTTDDQEDAV